MNLSLQRFHTCVASCDSSLSCSVAAGKLGTKSLFSGMSGLLSAIVIMAFTV